LAGATLDGVGVTEPPENKINTEKGLIMRDHLEKDVVVESVYHSWVKRKLSTQERANMLDFPVDRAVEMTDEDLLVLKRKEIPGKVLTAASWFLKQWNSEAQSQGPGLVNSITENSGPIDETEPSFEKTDQSYLDLQLEAKLLRFHEENGRDVVKIGLNRMRRERSGECGRGGSELPYFDFNTDDGNAKFSKFLGTFRKILQPVMLKRWKANVRKSFKVWYENTGKFMPDAASILADGLRACEKADGASWWEWEKGSALLFWRWPKNYIEMARIGIAPMFDSDPPSNQDKQPPFEEDEVRVKVKAKLEKILAKGYIELVDIELLEAMMFMLHVQKGPEDIRLVYDGTKSGLNESVFAPWFALPTIDSMSQWVIAGA
jgi:hypothetical protein